MRNFSPPDEAHLQAAVGWLELGNWREANEELDQLSPKHRPHPDVLKVRVKIYFAAEKWDWMSDVANSLCELIPDSSFGPIHLAYALRQKGEVQQAKTALVGVADRFTDEWQLPYLLSCCCCRLGEKTEAFRWLKQAIDVAGADDIRVKAMEEPDLEPLWLDLAEI